MLRINAVSSTPSRFVDLSAYKNVEVSEDVASPFLLQYDDVFIVRYNGDINRVAKAAIFKGEESTKAIYPDKLMRLRTNMKKMLPDFLVFALGSRTVREQIEELGKTTAGQIGVSGADAKSFIIPVPPVDEQRRIVDYLDSLQVKMDALKKLQAETTTELNALLPSILDKAFKGEL
jgi:type I restriction enzyme S subunit